MTEPSSKFVSISGVAEALGVSRQWVRELEASGVIPQAGRLEPGSRRVWPADTLPLMQQRVEERKAGGRRQPDPERV
ncbi:MAG: hypothetical protein M3R02_07350 [Chloroflexota bacterium]|nr:hypothetical protein [Chloroflexota bacterium]